MKPYTCTSCDWFGSSYHLRWPDNWEMFYGREFRGLCPKCWDEGFEAIVREKFGPLLESVMEKAERKPKRLIWWSDEELDQAQRIAQAQDAHEASDVVLKSDISGYSQFGFDFMREEFRVKSR